MFEKRQKAMDVINDFLKNNTETESSEETILVNEEEVNRINNMFASLHQIRPILNPIPEFRENQIWTVKTNYLDYEGVLQQAKHHMMVQLISEPEKLDSDTTFVRVCPISPFIELSSESDQICDDPSIIGFPFIVETWNEQPILTEILDSFVGDYYQENSDKNEILSKEQSDFREIEISNARFLNHSVTAYINEMERAENFSFSVDLQYLNFAKTVRMPVLNVKNPKIISLSNHEEYAMAARTGNCLTEDDSIELTNLGLPFNVEIRKKKGEYVLSIIPVVEIKLRNKGQEMVGMSNSERIVFSGLRKGLYEIESPLINNKISIRFK